MTTKPQKQPYNMFSDKLREKRNLGLRKMKTLGLVNIALSVLTLVVGIVTLVIAARGPAGGPVFNFGPAVVGILVSIV